MHIALQSGHFDYADRLFQSIPRTWDNMMHNTSDVKVSPLSRWLREGRGEGRHFEVESHQDTPQRPVEEELGVRTQCVGAIPPRRQLHVHTHPVMFGSTAIANDPHRHTSDERA